MMRYLGLPSVKKDGDVAFFNDNPALLYVQIIKLQKLLKRRNATIKRLKREIKIGKSK